LLIEPIPKFNIFQRLGSKEVFMEVEVINRSTHPQPKGQIRIEAHSYSNTTDQLNTVSVRKTENLSER